MRSTTLHSFYIIISFVFVAALFYFFKAAPLNGDSFLAWPITEKMADSSLYANDLLVQAGMETNFLLYKILAFFPFLSTNLPLRDVMIYFPIFIFYITCWGCLFYRVSGDFFISFLSIIIFLFSDNKLGLHWSYSPLTFLISYTSIHFLQILSLLMFYQAQYKRSFGILGLTSFIHPATSLCYFMVLAGIGFFDKNVRKFISPVFVFLGLFGLNYFYFLQSVDLGSFTSEHFYFYEKFQVHAYIRDHFHEGYLFYFSSLLFISNFSDILPKNYALFFRRITIIGLIFSGLWLVNLYFFKNQTFLYFYVPMRLFYLLKPMTLFSLTYISYKVFENKKFSKLDYLKSVELGMILILWAKTIFSFSSFDSMLIIFLLMAYLKNFSYFEKFFLLLSLLVSWQLNMKSLLEKTPWGYLTILLVFLWGYRIWYHDCSLKKLNYVE